MLCCAVLARQYQNKVDKVEDEEEDEEVDEETDKSTYVRCWSVGRLVVWSASQEERKREEDRGEGRCG